jgi:hypothetical protein
MHSSPDKVQSDEDVQRPDGRRTASADQSATADRAIGKSPGPAGRVSDFGQKVQVLAGLLVAGFAGALNFIGLRSGEVSTVLRNEPHYPTLVLALIVAGILTAVASIFVGPRSVVRKWVWRATACALLVPVSLTVALIPITGTTKGFEDWLAIGVAIAGGLLALAFCPAVTGKLKGVGLLKRFAARFPERDEKSPVLFQGLLVFTAIALTATATYAALRLETRSQLANTAAQLTATITETSPTASLHLSIDASKMAGADRVYVSVTGLQSGPTIASVCKGIATEGTLPCDQAPCYVTRLRGHLLDACVSLSSGVYQPNAEGSVQQTIDMPFSDLRYQRLELLGEVCAVQTSGQPCVYQTSHVTRVDIQVPRYAAQSP